MYLSAQTKETSDSVAKAIEGAGYSKDAVALAFTVYWEAAGEGKTDQNCVADVIVNRKDAGGGSILDVVTKAYQFSEYNGTSNTKKDAVKADDNLKKTTEYIKDNSGKKDSQILAALKSYQGILGEAKDRLDGTRAGVLGSGVKYYFSPKSMAEGTTDKNGCPKTWDMSKLKEVTVTGVSKDSFRFFEDK